MVSLMLARILRKHHLEPLESGLVRVKERGYKYLTDSPESACVQVKRIITKAKIEFRTVER